MVVNLGERPSNSAMSQRFEPACRATSPCHNIHAEGFPMPRDPWGREKARITARKANFEFATGQPPSYERLSEEVVPLDRVKCREIPPIARGLAPDWSGPLTTKSAARTQTSASTQPQQTTRVPQPSVARFPISQGVVVIVEHDGKSSLNAVHALEAALLQAKRGMAPAPNLQPTGSPTPVGPKTGLQSVNEAKPGSEGAKS
jgi:hypothetical protein